MAYTEYSKKDDKEKTGLASVKTSNTFITSIYDSTLTENQLLLMGLKHATRDKTGVYAVFSAHEIKKRLTNKQYESFYTQLKLASMKMGKMYMFFEDPKTHQFKYSNLIKEIRYDDGLFKINFNESFTPYLIDVHDNYTPLDEVIMFSFKTNTAFKLYQLLKSYCFVPKYMQRRGVKENEFKVHFTVSELKVHLQCVDTNDQAISYLFDGITANSDYDELLEKITKIAEKEKDPRIKKRLTPKWKEWRDFKKVIDKAVNEINEKDQNMRVDFEYAISGNKVRDIYFNIIITATQEELDLQIKQLGEYYMPNSDIEDESKEIIIEYSQPEDSASRENHMKLLMEASMITEYAFGVSELETLLNKSKGDVELLKKQYENMKKGGEIKNKMGWMIRAIENDYSEPEVFEHKEEKTKKSDFMKSDYDMDLLEKLAYNI